MKLLDYDNSQKEEGTSSPTIPRRARRKKNNREKRWFHECSLPVRHILKIIMYLCVLLVCFGYKIKLRHVCLSSNVVVAGE
jgi:hypothetical protein